MSYVMTLQIDILPFRLSCLNYHVNGFQPFTFQYFYHCIKELKIIKYFNFQQYKYKYKYLYE